MDAAATSNLSVQRHTTIKAIGTEEDKVDEMRAIE